MLDAYADRWALVTGASSGIGAEFARRLAARGMHLVLVARSEATMQELAADLDTRHGTHCHVLPMDLSEPQAGERIAAAVEQWGVDIELLVNSAGFGVVGEIEQTSVEKVAAMIQVNVAALTDLTYRFLPGMLAREHGAIVNISSVAAFQPVAWMGSYAATKAYVLHFSEALWAEVRHRGVTVTTVCPGVTQSGFFDAAGVPNWLKKQRSITPEFVVKATLKALEKRRLYVIPTWRNYFRSILVRMAPRKTVVHQTMDYFRPQTAKKQSSKD